jgi:DNA mismatch repair protein MutS2
VATSRSRVPGIVHDRSGSGQTVFVEPMEVIEANNEIALLAGQERREVESLLAGFGREVLAASDDLEAAVAQVGELDALEARVEFGEACGGRVVEISRDGGWTLLQARGIHFSIRGFRACATARSGKRGPRDRSSPWTCR